MLLIRHYTLQCCHAENRRDGVHRSQQHFPAAALPRAGRSGRALSVVPHGQANAAGAMAPEPADASAALQSRPVLRTKGGAAGATEVSDARKDFVRDPARAAKRRVA